MYEVIGFRYVDMTSEDGKPILGYSVFFAADEGDPGITGRSTYKIFVSAEKFPGFDPQVGDHYDLNFNQKGRLQGIRAAG